MNTTATPTLAQVERQRARENGRYRSMNTCGVCGRPVGEDYASSPHGHVLVICHRKKCGPIALDRERAAIEADGGCDCGFCRSEGWMGREQQAKESK